MLFGLMLIVWFAWLGAVLMMTKATEAGTDQSTDGVTGRAWPPYSKRFQPTRRALD